MATHRLNSNERVIKDIARLLVTLRKLGVFDRDLHIVTDDIRMCVYRWKVKVFGDKSRTRVP